jgi:hypothetical protein
MNAAAPKRTSGGAPLYRRNSGLENGHRLSIAVRPANDWLMASCRSGWWLPVR